MVITSEELHEAADKLTDATEDEWGEQLDQVQVFLRQSDFPNADVDPMSTAFGILIALKAVKTTQETN